MSQCIFFNSLPSSSSLFLLDPPPEHFSIIQIEAHRREVWALKERLIKQFTSSSYGAAENEWECLGMKYFGDILLWPSSSCVELTSKCTYGKELFFHILFLWERFEVRGAIEWLSQSTFLLYGNEDLLALFSFCGLKWWWWRARNEFESVLELFSHNTFLPFPSFFRLGSV